MTLATDVARRYLAALRDPNIDMETFVLGQEEHLLQVDVPAHRRRRLPGRRSRIGTASRIKRAGRVTRTKGKAKKKAASWSKAGPLEDVNASRHDSARVAGYGGNISEELVDLAAAMVVVADERAALRERRLQRQINQIRSDP